MKTLMTLKHGSFYFLSTVNLTRGIPVEVDLARLTPGELKGIKAYVAAGAIETKDDISGYGIPGSTADTKTTVAAKIVEKAAVKAQVEAKPEPKAEETVEVKEEAKVVEAEEAKEEQAEEVTVEKKAPARRK